MNYHVVVGEKILSSYGAMRAYRNYDEFTAFNVLNDDTGCAYCCRMNA